VWNETDPGRRRDLIARTWTRTARYRDPLLAGDGPEGIDAMVAAVHDKYPGHAFRRTSDVDAHNGHLRFAWELAPEGGPVLASGVDFATVADDGRLATVTGFFDYVATPPAPTDR
ncbi:MAG: nuclear transport factor 2 family protein, partial [Bauldia litoralis]